jgi:transcriptional regulator with GAF, ATPase, and Fis domain
MLRIGRAVGDGLRLDHPSVSRHHAELAYRDGAWRLRDLDSKNGSFVDGIRVHDMPLARACWLRLGDIYLEFTPISAAEAEASERGQRQRRASISARTARLDGLAQLDDLLEASLRGVVELAQCERGFVLLAQGDRFAVRASLALTPAQLSSSAFSGSVSAIRRALDQRRSVVVNEIGLDPWLASRESVVAGDLNAVVCLPLLDGRQALGAIYADRVRPGPAITTLDLELLKAFAETASLWLAARRTSDLLAGVESDLDWDAIVAAHEAAP